MSNQTKLALLGMLITSFTYPAVTYAQSCQELFQSEQAIQSSAVQGIHRDQQFVETELKDATLEVFERTATQDKLIQDTHAVRGGLVVSDGQIIRIKAGDYEVEFALPKPLDLESIKANQAGLLIESATSLNEKRGASVKSTSAKFNGEVLVIQRDFIKETPKEKLGIQSKITFKIAKTAASKVTISEISILNQISDARTLETKFEALKMNLQNPFEIVTKTTAPIGFPRRVNVAPDSTLLFETNTINGKSALQVKADGGSLKLYLIDSLPFGAIDMTKQAKFSQTQAMPMTSDILGQLEAPLYFSVNGERFVAPAGTYVLGKIANRDQISNIANGVVPILGELTLRGDITSALK